MKSSPLKNSPPGEKIFKAAQKVFSAHGFSGAPISKIAKEAGVSPGLIYHYAKNKEDLWRKTKKYIYEKHHQIHYDSFKKSEIEKIDDLLICFIEFQLITCKKAPDLSRILAWQRLEENQKELTGLYENSITDWIEAIKKLQKMGSIADESNPLLVLLVIFNMVEWRWMPAFSQIADEVTTLESYESNLLELLKYILKSFPLLEKSSQ